jgi:hypothetical protein
MEKVFPKKVKIVSPSSNDVWDFYNPAAWLRDAYYYLFIAGKYDKDFQKFIESSINLAYVSTVPRQNIISWILYNGINNMKITDKFLKINDDIVTVFRIKHKTQYDVIYGVLYSHISQTGDNSDEIFGVYPEKGETQSSKKFTVKHRILSTGPSFVSSDGEYRGRIISYKVMTTCQETFRDILEDVEAYLNEKIKRIGLEFSVQHFFPRHDMRKTESVVDYTMIYNRIQKNMYAICWFNDIYNEFTNIVENHINKQYNDMIKQTLPEDMKFFKLLIKKYSRARIDDLRSKSTNIISGFKYGQKIIPLNLVEVQSPFNMIYKPWKELAVAKRLSDCVLSLQTPGLPVCLEWMYIRNSRKGLFDGEAQYNRMEKSDMAKDVVVMLKRVKELTGDIVGNYKSKKLNDIKSSLLAKFKSLYNKIDIPIQFALDDIIMSDVALCMFSEYTGRTFMDSILLSKKSKYLRDLIGDIFSKDHIDIFHKYLFDLCYTIHVINNAGVIHGDLHLNNVTLRPKYYKNFRDIYSLKDPFEIFVADRYKFATPTMSYNTCLIDFSRSFIDIEKLDEFRDPLIPKMIFDPLENKDAFIEEQNNSIVLTYIQLFPEMEDVKEDLLNLLKNHFAAAFKILTTMDIFRFTRNMTQLFNIKSPDIPHAHQGMFDILDKINKLAKTFLTLEMQKMLSDKKYIEIVETTPPPMLSIIVKCFSHFLFDPDKKYGVMVDIFDSNNPLKFSVNDVNNAPNYLINGYMYKTQHKKDLEHIGPNNYFKKYEVVNLIRNKIRFINKQTAQKKYTKALLDMKDEIREHVKEFE